MHKYRIVGKKGEGTFSEVLRGQSVATGRAVAIKCMKHTFESAEQVNNLREIQALRRLTPHPQIVQLLEVLYDQPTGRLALAFELMECNIYELIKGRKVPLGEARVKSFMYQLLKAVEHMHSHGVFHRDIKPENLLIMDDTLKLADFGSCRAIHSRKPFTEYISTRWYRAPECLLTDGYYGAEMDMWGIGCVMYEVVALQPLFPGADEADQIDRIHKVLGTPTGSLLAKFRKHGSTHVDWNFAQYAGNPDLMKRAMASYTPDALQLLQQMLLYDPEARITAKAALRHPWFSELRAADARVKGTPDSTIEKSGADVVAGPSVSTSPAKRQTTESPLGKLPSKAPPREIPPTSVAPAPSGMLLPRQNAVNIVAAAKHQVDSSAAPTKLPDPGGPVVMPVGPADRRPALMPMPIPKKLQPLSPKEERHGIPEEMIRFPGREPAAPVKRLQPLLPVSKTDHAADSPTTFSDLSLRKLPPGQTIIDTGSPVEAGKHLQPSTKTALRVDAVPAAKPIIRLMPLQTSSTTGVGGPTQLQIANPAPAAAAPSLILPAASQVYPKGNVIVLSPTRDQPSAAPAVATRVAAASTLPAHPVPLASILGHDHHTHRADNLPGPSVTKAPAMKSPQSEAMRIVSQYPATSVEAVHAYSKPAEPLSPVVRRALEPISSMSVGVKKVVNANAPSVVGVGSGGGAPAPVPAAPAGGPVPLRARDAGPVVTSPYAMPISFQNMSSGARKHNHAHSSQPHLQHAGLDSLLAQPSILSMYRGDTGSVAGSRPAGHILSPSAAAGTGTSGTGSTSGGAAGSVGYRSHLRKRVEAYVSPYAQSHVRVGGPGHAKKH